MIRTPRTFPALTATISVAALAALQSPAGATAAPGTDVPKGKVDVALVAAKGSGCAVPVVGLAPDRTAVTVTYPKYRAQSGKGAKPADAHRECQVAVRVKAPKGFTYGVDKAEYRGFATLGDGVVGTLRAGYHFQGSPRAALRAYTLRGALSSDWTMYVKTAREAVVWAPCDGREQVINVNTELLVDRGKSGAGTASSFMAMDSAEGAGSTTYRLAWKRC
ncbi:DUF4360 domain-containing protein [Streptomyces sp. 4.24]|uniref:DUF4360 domain-containing protein n=1 Tax=Streptomyces tritrimontium TaxID=3406573 RepID=UPI003BB4F3AF